MILAPSTIQSARRAGRAGRVPVAALVLAVGLAWTGVLAAVEAEAGSEATDLTRSGLFSEGWDQPWTRRSRGDGTPDMSLLKVQTNFLAQLLRIDTYLETGLTAPGSDRSEFASLIAEYAINRRFMTAFFVSHRWVEKEGGRGDDGASGGLFERVQLVDRRQESMAFNVKMTLPAKDLGEQTTLWSYALAGWEDLQGIGLGRTGLYWHVQHEIAGGPLADGASRNDATYALSLATSWTGSRDRLENFTTFVEGYGKTYLDGDHAGRTVVTITPGLRFTLGGRQIFMAGVDLPVVGPRSYDTLYRLTWIYNF